MNADGFGRPDGGIQSAWTTFALHPPIGLSLDRELDRYLALLPYASVVCELNVNNRPLVRKRLRAGSITLIEPNTHIRVRQIEPVETLILTIDAARVKYIGDTAASQRPWHARTVVGLEDAGVTAISQEFRRSLLADHLTEQAYLQSLADALITRLICQFLGEIDRSSASEALSPAVLARIAQYIDAHLGDPLEVSELASMARLTRSHFSRAFQRMTGDAPQRFIMKRRICRARELLSSGEKPLADIAASAGFSSQAHMSTLFKKEIGTTPAQYRRAFPTPAKPALPRPSA